jgi:hypothetical protein
MSLSNSLPIRAGFANFFQPYSATVIPTTTSIEQSSLTKFAGGYWILNTVYEIKVSAKRLATKGAQLGNMEREIMKIVCLYVPDQILGIEDMTYLGQERIYGINDSFAKSEWETRIMISVKYHVVNEDAF